MTDVERMARAIYDLMEGPVANQDFARQQRQWVLAQDLTLAVLKTMRERPADCMIDAASRYMPSGSRDIAHHALALAFSAAIAEHEGRE